MRRRTWALFCAVLCLSALALFTTGCGSSSSSSNGTNIRLVNAMPDENNLDLLVDGTSSVTSVGYGLASSYTSVASGSRHFQVEATGFSTVLIDRTDSISANSNYTLISQNFSFNASSVLLIDDNTAPTAGNFKLRIVNASPGMDVQDVYIVPDGTDITSVDPTFPGMGFGASSSYSQLAAGDYRVFFTVPNQKFINLDSGKLTFASGQVRTLLGLDNPGGGFESTQLTDKN